jgi:hypothetical protein
MIDFLKLLSGALVDCSDRMRREKRSHFSATTCIGNECVRDCVK